MQLLRYYFFGFLELVLMERTNQKLYFRKLNQSFYSDLEKIHKLLIPTGLRILEIGCGVGDLLAALKPSYGVGIELDVEASAFAQQRHPHLKFYLANFFSCRI